MTDQDAITAGGSRVLYHIGKKPARPVPKRVNHWKERGQPEPAWVRPWLDAPVQAGVFLTTNPSNVAHEHGVFGNVYAYKVPHKVIKEAMGLHRYDHATEVLIPEPLWDQVKFMGKSMDEQEFREALLQTENERSYAQHNRNVLDLPRQRERGSGRVAGSWGYFPWEGDGPLDQVWGIQDAVDPKPGVKRLMDDFDKIPKKPGSGHLAGEHWAWVGTVFLSAEVLHGLPMKVIKKALEVVEQLPELEGYDEWVASWKVPSKLEPARAEVLKALTGAIERGAGKNGRVQLYKGDMKTAAARVAAKFQKKKEVPKADGKGTMTVYEYSDRQVQHRNREKAKRIEKLRTNITKLRKQVKTDLTSSDDKTRLTALAIALMDETYERVGNEGSAKEGHFGVTGWQAKHVTISGSKATIKYVGKSGVKQEKTISSGSVLTALKRAMQGKSGTTPVLCEGDDCRVLARDVNAYLKPHNVTAKDIRGLHANEEVKSRLKAVRSNGGKLPSDKKERIKKLKAEFKEALEGAAGAVGHKASTLKSQYLVPGVEDTYLKDGTVSVKHASSGHVASRWAGSVVPFPGGAESRRPKGPTLKIKSTLYVLSTYSGSIAGDLADEPEDSEFGARVIRPPASQNKWKYLWVLDTDRDNVAMWRAHDGNEKAYGRARLYQRDLIQLDRKGQLNRVSHEEFQAISREMRGREDKHNQDLADWVKELETDYQKEVNKLALELFDREFRPDIERQMSAVRRGVVPFGFKYDASFEEATGHDRTHQAVTHVINEGLGEFTMDKVEAYLRKNGIDPDAPNRDIQAAYWAVGDIQQGFWEERSTGRRFRFGATYDRTNPDTLKWVKGFFSRHPKLRRFAGIPVVHVEEPNRRRHPEASYTSKGIELYPKFRQLSAGVQDFVFAHEIGHAVLEKWGNRKFMSAAAAVGVDPWDTPNLPFAQHNFDEAFADSFASYHVDGDVQRRYPEWSSLVSVSLGVVRGASMRVATKTPAEKEDAEVERLSRPSPKLKPPRKDKRREQIKEHDPDLDEKDKDMSLNYKDSSARLAARWLYGAAAKQRYKVVNTESGKESFRTEEEIRASKGKYQLVKGRPKKKKDDESSSGESSKDDLELPEPEGSSDEDDLELPEPEDEGSDKKPEAPEAPKAPKKPEAPEAPKAPKKPKKPESPKAPKKPKKPESQDEAKVEEAQRQFNALETALGSYRVDYEKSVSAVDAQAYEMDIRRNEGAPAEEISALRDALAKSREELKEKRERLEADEERLVAAKKKLEKAKKWRDTAEDRAQVKKEQLERKQQIAVLVDGYLRSEDQSEQTRKEVGLTTYREFSDAKVEQIKSFLKDVNRDLANLPEGPSDEREAYEAVLDGVELVALRKGYRDIEITDRPKPGEMMRDLATVLHKNYPGLEESLLGIGRGLEAGSGQKIKDVLGQLSNADITRIVGADQGGHPWEKMGDLMLSNASKRRKKFARDWMVRAVTASLTLLDPLVQEVIGDQPPNKAALQGLQKSWSAGVLDKFLKTEDGDEGSLDQDKMHLDAMKAFLKTKWSTIVGYIEEAAASMKGRVEAGKEAWADLKKKWEEAKTRMSTELDELQKKWEEGKKAATAMLKELEEKWGAAKDTAYLKFRAEELELQEEWLVLEPQLKDTIQELSFEAGEGPEKAYKVMRETESEIKMDLVFDAEKSLKKVEKVVLELEKAKDKADARLDELREAAGEKEDETYNKLRQQERSLSERWSELRVGMREKIEDFQDLKDRAWDKAPATRDRLLKMEKKFMESKFRHFMKAMVNSNDMSPIDQGITHLTPMMASLITGSVYDLTPPDRVWELASS